MTWLSSYKQRQNDGKYMYNDMAQLVQLSAQHCHMIGVAANIVDLKTRKDDSIMRKNPECQCFPLYLKHTLLVIKNSIVAIKKYFSLNMIQ